MKPVRPQYTYEAVEAAIKEYIIENELQPGDPLPSERELAQALGVSRPSVREAIRSLSVLGLVDVRTGEGTFVRNIDFGKVIKDLSPLLVTNPRTVIEMQEVREELEVMACRRAATRLTEEQKGKLAQNLAAMEEAVRRKQPSRGLELDLAFNNLIYEAAANQVLQQMADSITDLVHEVRVAGLRVVPDLTIMLEQHREIYDGLISGDPEQAARAMRQHMQGVMDVLRQGCGLGEWES